MVIVQVLNVILRKSTFYFQPRKKKKKKERDGAIVSEMSHQFYTRRRLYLTGKPESHCSCKSLHLPLKMTPCTPLTCALTVISPPQIADLVSYNEIKSQLDSKFLT